MTRYFFAVALAAFISFPIQAATSGGVRVADNANLKDALYAKLYGRWEGETTYQYYEAAEEKEKETRPLRIDIDPSRIEFFHTTEDGSWRTRGLKFTNSFHFQSEKNTLLGSFFRSGSDEDGVWVESQTMYITVKDDNTILIYWMRAVNNTDEKDGKPGSKWMTLNLGELHKVH